MGGTNGAGRVGVGVGPLSGGSGDTMVGDQDTTGSDCELKPALKVTWKISRKNTDVIQALARLGQM